MASKRKTDTNPSEILAGPGKGRSTVKYVKHQVVFSQGDPADAVFYIQKGNSRSR